MSRREAIQPEDLKHFSVLVEFTEGDREQLVELLEPIRIPRGRMLFREGEEADALYLVRAGRLSVSTEAHGELGELGVGAAIGAASLVVIGARQASVEALGEVELVLLSRESFRRLAEDAPRAACRLVEAIVADLVGTLRPNLNDIT